MSDDRRVNPKGPVANFYLQARRSEEVREKREADAESQRRFEDLLKHDARARQLRTQAVTQARTQAWVPPSPFSLFGTVIDRRDDVAPEPQQGEYLAPQDTPARMEPERPPAPHTQAAAPAPMHDAKPQPPVSAPAPRLVPAQPELRNEPEPAPEFPAREAQPQVQPYLQKMPQQEQMVPHPHIPAPTMQAAPQVKPQPAEPPLVKTPVVVPPAPTPATQWLAPAPAPVQREVPLATQARDAQEDETAPDAVTAPALQPAQAQPQLQSLRQPLAQPQPLPSPQPASSPQHASPVPVNEVLEARIGAVLQQLAATGNVSVAAKRADVKSETTTTRAAHDGDSLNKDDTPLDAHAETFRQAMQRGSHDHSGGGHSGGQPRDDGHREHILARETDATPAALPISPSGVFGARQPDMPATAPAPTREPDTASLGRRIGEAVERLMVGDGRNGNRQVRMDLKDDLLEGVSVTVQELDGRMQVDFACAVESSRLRLNSAAPGQARDLATRLSRKVLLRIHTGDETDEHLLEVAAQP